MESEASQAHEILGAPLQSVQHLWAETGLHSGFWALSLVLPRQGASRGVARGAQGYVVRELYGHNC